MVAHLWGHNNVGVTFKLCYDSILFQDPADSLGNSVLGWGNLKTSHVHDGASCLLRLLSILMSDYLFRLHGQWIKSSNEDKSWSVPCCPVLLQKKLFLPTVSAHSPTCYSPCLSANYPWLNTCSKEKCLKTAIWNIFPDGHIFYSKAVFPGIRWSMYIKNLCHPKTSNFSASICVVLVLFIKLLSWLRCFACLGSFRTTGETDASKGSSVCT